MSLQYQPRRFSPDQPSDAPYAPERDVAYVFSGIAQMLPQFFDGKHTPEMLKDLLNSTNTKESDLHRGAEILREGFKRCLDPECGTPNEALKAVGFWALPSAVQTSVMTVVGLSVYSEYFRSIRFATLGDAPPRIIVASEAMQDVIAAGKEATKKDPLIGRFIRGIWK